MGRRKCEGEVSLHNDKGKIRLWWRLTSKRYSLSLFWIYTRIVSFGHIWLVGDKSPLNPFPRQP
jgi:hypothetical protein